MGIDRILEKHKLEPEHCQSLKQAFDLALCSLHLVDRDDPIVEIVARKIVEIGTNGVRDPTEISKIAVRQLAGPGCPPACEGAAARLLQKKENS